MSDVQQSKILVRCKCGKKFRISTTADEIGVACPSCGHTLRLSPSTTLLSESPHWTQNLLWMAWAIPVSIAIIGLIYIVIRENQDRPLVTVQQQAPEQPPAKPQEAVAENSAEPVAEAEPQKPAEQVAVVVPQEQNEGDFEILFPGREFPRVEDLGLRDQGTYLARYWKSRTTGSFIVEENRLVSRSGEYTAVVLQPHVKDFDLQIGGDLTDRGNMFFLVGWDRESSSGYLLYNFGFVQPWPWQVLEINRGELVPPEVSLPRRLRFGESGELNLSIKDGKLSMDFSGYSLAKDYALPAYKPGAIIFGTQPNQYKGKAVKIDHIRFRQ